jgi:hypothetical protein
MAVNNSDTKDSAAVLVIQKVSTLARKPSPSMPR